MKNMAFQVLLVLLASVLLDQTNAQPLDKIDRCLFSCDYCFEGEILVTCANECLNSEVVGMRPIWTSVCPYFGIMKLMER